MENIYIEVNEDIRDYMNHITKFRVIGIYTTIKKSINKPLKSLKPSDIKIYCYDEIFDNVPYENHISEIKDYKYSYKIGKKYY